MAQNRLKSPVVWAAVLAQLMTILLALEIIDFELGETINRIVAGVLQMLVVFGVLNNPTDVGNF